MAESVFNDLVQLRGAFLETASENIITHDDIHSKNAQSVRDDANSLEQCCAAHIVQCFQQYCSALLSLN